MISESVEGAVRVGSYAGRCKGHQRAEREDWLSSGSF
jgi:hypothetical protein